MRVIMWLALLCAAVPPALGQQRPYRIDDHLYVEEIQGHSVTMAPNGQAVAWTTVRAANTQLTNGLVGPNTRADVWIQDEARRPPRNLTNGAADSSGWWAPQWSPNGQWLAFLSSRGGEVRLWGWERAKNEVRVLSPDGIDFGDAGGCQWLDATRLLCVALPDGERSTPLGSNGFFDGKAVERVEAAWAAAKRGEITASVVQSLEFRLPRRRLLLVDVVRGRSDSLTVTQRADAEGWVPHYWVSPTGQTVAFVQPSEVSFGRIYRSQAGDPAAIDIRRLDGPVLQLSRPLPANVVTSTIQWSPDGQALAFFALEDALIHPELIYRDGASDVRYPAVASKEYPGRLWRVDLARGTVDRLATGDIDLGQGPTPPPFQWTAKGDLLFRASRLIRGARPLTPAPAEWLVLSRDGRTRALGRDNQRLPESLEAMDGGRAFLGLLDGDVWRVDPGTAKNLTAGLVPSVRDLRLIHANGRTTHAVVSFVAAPESEAEKVAVRDNWSLHQLEWIGAERLRRYAVLELATGVIGPLSKPAANAIPLTYSGTSNVAMWGAQNRDGTFLWRSVGSQPAAKLVGTNLFWKNVATGEQRMIKYTTTNGEVMDARIVLPVGYQPGRRYPLVVDFDIGSPSSRPHASFELSPSSVPFYWEVPYATAGYVFLWASWPSTSMDQIGRANLLLGPNGIVPAVEKAIELGIADPDRIFVQGASSAGYGVYGLVTQTSRFKAAWAHAGWVDQTTYRLATTIHDRYTDNPFDGTVMGASYNPSRLPFWRNGEFYRRNSPLSYVDRVQTPLLITHGDLDRLPITEPEVFFKALVAQRKPAQFVRYWGEGHFIQTPANMRDRWQRVFAWFDQWGDITRDAAGSLVFEGERVKSRGDAPALRPEDYAKFPLFSPDRSSAASRRLAVNPVEPN